MSGKRGVSGTGTSIKGHSNSKDAMNGENPNGQFCNRIGCSGKIKYSQSTNAGSSDKVNNSKPSIPSSNGKGITGKSASSSSAIGNLKRSNLDSKKKLPSKPKCDSSESSQSSASESRETVSSPPSGSGWLKSGEAAPVKETGSSSVSSSNVRSKKVFHHKSSLQNRNNKVSSSVSAISSLLESEHNGKMNGAKKRSLVGESSSSCRGISDSKQSSSFEEGSSSVTSASTQRSMNETTRTKLSSQQNVRMPRSSVRQPRVPDNEIPPNGQSFSTSRQSSSSVDERFAAPSLRTRRLMSTRVSAQQQERSSSVRLPTQVPDNGFSFGFASRSSGRQFTARTYGLSSSNCDVPSTSTPHDFLCRHRMDEIAEVLLALERIEQDDEFSHERLLALETSLLLGSLSIYDQHRDMRLDIDNMSYEELLALEERMGTVNTALSEEALSNCLERSIYQPTSSKSPITETGKNGDSTKCSVCQEEYEVGDEVGKLVECQHFYHEACINQWLRLKNWCPVCKGSVLKSHTS